LNSWPRLKPENNLVAPDPAEAEVMTQLSAEIHEIYREHGEARAFLAQTAR